MAELVIGREQFFLLRLDALLDAHVGAAVELPGARVTLYVPITRLLQKRAAPKSIGERRKPKRYIKRLRLPRNFDFVVLLRFELGGDIEIVHTFEWLDERVNLGPLLRPHVAEQ